MDHLTITQLIANATLTVMALVTLLWNVIKTLRNLNTERN